MPLCKCTSLHIQRHTATQHLSRSSTHKSHYIIKMEFDGVLNVSLLKCQTNKCFHDTSDRKCQHLPHRQEGWIHYKDQSGNVSYRNNRSLDRTHKRATYRSNHRVLTGQEYSETLLKHLALYHKKEMIRPDVRRLHIWEQNKLHDNAFQTAP
jgi:hypothetical protein